MTTHTCKHVSKYKRKNGMKSYRLLSKNFISCSTDDALRRKAKEVYCYACKNKSKRLHACLHCVYIGCFKKHVKEHSKKRKHHNIFTDLQSGNLFCMRCKDYVYDEDFEVISRKNRRKVGIVNGESPYIAWEPTAADINILKKHGGIRRIKADSYMGLRGLVNLGNTCYINCVIQVLVHIPILRNYFLSQNHHCDTKKTCIACEMTNIVQEFYNGSHIPFVPCNIIYLMWKHLLTKAEEKKRDKEEKINPKELVGFEQRDAHEYFLKILDVLHNDCESDEGRSKCIKSAKTKAKPAFQPKTPPNIPVKDEAREPKPICRCIIHQIFTGFYESRVFCHNCLDISPTFEPFWDISLDIDTEVQENGSSGSKLSKGLHFRLLDCLYNYTSSESLNSICLKCNSLERSKQLLISKLPILVCFHLKRLKKSRRKRNDTSKDNSHIEFPEFLDMTPFMASNCDSQIDVETENNTTLFPNDNKYYLIAIINHIGNDVGGHYTSYIRQIQNYWYKCDDALITKVTDSDVMNSTGYMLFYLKHTLEYGTNSFLDEKRYKM